MGARSADAGTLGANTSLLFAESPGTLALLGMGRGALGAGLMVRPRKTS